MKFRRLEAVRGFASLYVCLTHIVHPADNATVVRTLLSFGQEAVVVFFVLSGFVIQWTAGRADKTEPFHRYFLKRFVRIYSVWTVAVVVLFLIAWAETGAIVNQPIGRWLGNILMLQDWAQAKPAVICRPLYGDTPLWSLHYEWWFYMLFPLVNRAIRPPERKHAVGCLAVLNAVVYAIVPNPLSRLLMYLSIWWVGVDAAHTLRNRGSICLSDLGCSLGYVAATAVPGVFAILASFPSFRQLSPGTHPLLEVRHLATTLPLVSAAFLWRASGWPGFSIALGPCAAVAPISFSLYVLHYKSIATASFLRFLGNPVLELAIYVGLTGACCCLAELVLYPRLRAWLKL